MESILSGLFSFALMSLDYDKEIEQPKLNQVSQQKIMDTVCMGKRCGAQAYYDDNNETVFILESLDLVSSYMDRSYVLHEMVHHVQKKKYGVTAKSTDCNYRLALEREAYEIQMEYLISENQNAFQIRYILSRFPHSC